MAMGGLSELQLSLIGAGLVAVAGVWGYNAWQEYRQRKLAQRIFGNDRSADVLMQGETAEADPDAAGETSDQGTPERIEPRFAAAEDEDIDYPEAVETRASEPPVEHAAERPAQQSAEPLAGQTTEQPVEQLLEPPAELADDLVDCIARLEAPELIAAPLLWAAQRQLLRTFDARLRWSGLDENTGQWRKLHAQDAQSYRHLCAALQIADRNGPVNAADLARFFDALRQLAENFQARIALPVATEVLAHAQAIDEFCAGVDWRIGVNVVNRHDQPFGAARLIDLATETSLWLKDDGMFHAENENGLTVFTLGALGGQPLAADGLGALTLDGVTLSIDVPRVADGTQAFDRLLGVAWRLMEVFDGVLVDDQRTPLSDEMLATIGAKIEEFQQKMAANHIPAGGRRALRLYS